MEQYNLLPNKSVLMSDCIKKEMDNSDENDSETEIISVLVVVTKKFLEVLSHWSSVKIIIN
jgi:hypothetical protein